LMSAVLSLICRLTKHSNLNTKYSITKADNRKCKPDKFHILHEVLFEI
jgi:hypothetical protein